MIFFLLYTGVFVARFFYKWSPPVYVALQPLFYVCHSCAAPTLYYIVFRMTAPKKAERFPRIHIVLPLIMPAVLAVWIPLMPFEVPLGIVNGMREINPQWPLFSQAFASVMAAEIIFDGVYLLLSFLRLRSYNRRISPRKKKDTDYRLYWISPMLMMIGGAWIHPIAIAFTSMEAVYEAQWLALLSTAAIFAMEIMLLYNLQQHKYPPLDIQLHTKSPIVPEKGIGEKTVVQYLSQKALDDYFRQMKPYLDPGLRLTTLAETFGIRREELSGFVNKTYGMGFSEYVNGWRLREFEKISKQKANEGILTTVLVKQAGFGSYSSYRRARMETKGKTIGEIENQNGEQT